MITRYDITNGSGFFNDLYIEPSSDGEYVEFGDIEELLDYIESLRIWMKNVPTD